MKSRYQPLLKNIAKQPRLRALSMPALLVVACGILAACEDRPLNRISWSPDGKTMTVIAADGLHLSDPEGRISSTVLATGVEQVEWLPDSAHAVLSEKGKIASWEEAQKLLSADELAATKKEVAIMTDLLDDEKPVNPDDPDVKAKLDAMKFVDEDIVCLFATGSEQVKKQLRTLIKQPTYAMTVSDVDVRELTETSAEITRDLYKSRNDVVEIRVSPNGKNVAIVEDTPDDKYYRLLVMSVEGGTPREVSARANRYPDWSADGQSLVFIERDANSNWNFDRGTLQSRRVSYADGKFLLEFDDAKNLADVPFTRYARVRATKDNRVVFSANEAHLPDLSGTSGAMKLYVVDPDRYHAVIPVGAEKDYGSVAMSPELFEVNQDATQIVVPGTQGEVALIELAKGAATFIQGSATTGALSMAPKFHTATELTMVAPTASTDGDKHTSKVVLFNTKDKTEANLSLAWPLKVVSGWLAPSKNSH